MRKGVPWKRAGLRVHVARSYTRSSHSAMQGFKCKFSHDLAVERKTQKIDLFSDRCQTARASLSEAPHPPAAPHAPLPLF